MEKESNSQEEIYDGEMNEGSNMGADTTEENITGREDISPQEFKEININDSQHPSEEDQSEEQTSQTSQKNSRQNSVSAPDGLSVTMSNNKLNTFKEWSKNRITYTKQLLSESFGFGTKTVDIEIEKKINFLNESKVMCTAMIAKAQAVLNHMTAMNSAQRQLSQFFCETSLRELSPYKDELMCNGEMYREINKHMDSYEGVLRMFISNLTTLNDKTLDDSLFSVRQYEACRVEYDAYRVEYEEMQRTSQINETKLKEGQSKYEHYLQRFNQTRTDLMVKIKLFEENKDKVIKRNLSVLQDTLSKYTKECANSLTDVASHYHFKPIIGSSWLENSP